MKKIISALALVIVGTTSAFAQGTIDFMNRNISTRADPTVLYHVPIWEYGGRASGSGAGNLPGGYIVGLFLAGAPDTAMPIVSTPLRTGTPVQAQFFAISTQTATIDGVPAGQAANLLVRGWQGSSFAAAKAGTGQYFETSFTSLPLGGTPPGGGLPVPTPGMTGWGPENGSGFEIIPEPSTMALGVVGLGLFVLRRRKMSRRVGKENRRKKKIISALALVIVGTTSAFAQGTIDFINRNISSIADPTVLYHVPIYGYDRLEGAGNLPGGVTLGLFLAGAPIEAPAIFSQKLRTGTPAQAAFLISGPGISTTATIPNVPAGQSANLLVRAWQGESYAAATASGGANGQWAFTSLPLGGAPPGGGTPIPTPGMTGWGPENGVGYILIFPEPSTIALGAVGLGALLLRPRKSV